MMNIKYKTIIVWLVFIPLSFIWDIFFFVAQQLYFLLKSIDELGEKAICRIEQWYKEP